MADSTIGFNAEKHRITAEEELDYSVFAIDNPNSLYNLIESDRFRGAMEHARAKRPRLFFAGEKEIKKEAKPTGCAKKFRLALWEEYNNAVDAGKKIRLRAVSRQIVTTEWLTEHLYQDPALMVFICTMPQSYTYALRDILDTGLREMAAIMELPLFYTNANGKKTVNTSVVNAKIKCFQLIDERVKGAVVQRMQIEQRNLNVSIKDNVDLMTLPLSELEKLQRKQPDEKLKLGDGVVDIEASEKLNS